MLKTLFILGVVAATLAIVSVASAASPHYKGGKNAGPSFTDTGLTLTAAGSVSGLGNADVLITVTAVGDPTALCTNPGDQSKVPGQNPAPAEVTGSQAIPASEVKNGNLSFSLATEAPESPIPGAPDCPNPGWTETITDMAFTSVTLTIEQPPGTVLGSLTVSCSFDATSNGDVVSC